MIDIVFALDGSEGVTQESFDAQKSFVTGSLKAYEIGPGKTRVGVLVYGSKAIENFKVEDGVSRPFIGGQVQNADMIGGIRRIARAVNFATSNVFDGISDGERKKLLVVVAAGERPVEEGDEFRSSLDEMKKQGIEVLIIGVGPNVNAEKLGASMKEDNIKQVDKSDRINTKLTDVVDTSEKLTGLYF